MKCEKVFTIHLHRTEDGEGDGIGVEIRAGEAPSREDLLEYAAVILATLADTLAAMRGDKANKNEPPAMVQIITRGAEYAESCAGAVAVQKLGGDGPSTEQFRRPRNN